MKNHVFDVSEASEMLDDWYGVALPEDFLRSIFIDNDDLMEELIAGGIGDTCVRSEVMDAICKKLGINVTSPSKYGLPFHWPLYGDTAEYRDEFQRQFYDKIHAIGGKTRWQP